MRNFQIIKIEADTVRLVEIYTYNGVCKDFTGSTCISDALRHMNRICSTNRKFEIITIKEATR
jgi:hypothetical protein